MNKTSGGDGIPAELFQILKYSVVRVLHSICQQIWKTQQWPQGWKSQFSFRSQRKAMPKDAQTTAQLHSSHRLVKQCSIVYEQWTSRCSTVQQYVNHELPDVQAGFRIGRGTRDQIAHIRWIIKKQESSRKTSISASLTMSMPLTVWITTL